MLVNSIIKGISKSGYVIHCIILKKFFDTDNANPEKVVELYKSAKRLQSEWLKHLITIAKGLQSIKLNNKWKHIYTVFRLLVYFI